jgi:hypothetical protein
MLEAIDRLPLCFDLRRGFVHLRHKPAGIELGEELSLSNTISFLRQHTQNSLAVVKGQVGLPKIDIPVQNQASAFVSAMQPKPSPGRGGG